MSVCKMECNKTELFNILKVLARIATVGGRAFLRMSRHVFTSVCSRSNWKFEMAFLLIPRNSILLIKVFASCPIWNCRFPPWKQIQILTNIHVTGHCCTFSSGVSTLTSAISTSSLTTGFDTVFSSEFSISPSPMVSEVLEFAKKNEPQK